MKNFRMSSLRKFATPMLALMIGTTGVSHVGAATIYGFAQQKVYNMTLNSSATLTATPFDVVTNTSAALSGYPGVAFLSPALDATQSKIGVFASPGLPNGRVDPPENYIGAAPFASAGGINVLTQANPTTVGIQNAVDSSVPIIGEFNTADYFSRSDVYVTTASGNPIQNTSPLQGATPAGYPLNGSNIPVNQLFAPKGSGPSISIDSSAESLLNSNGVDLGTATSTWAVSGAFNLAALGTVELNFELVDRLVVYSNYSPTPQALGENNFSFVIKDLNDNTVASSSVTRTLTSPLAGEATYNGNTTTAGFVWQDLSGNSISFQSSQLKSGNYTFTISGITQVDVKSVPEPSTYVMMGLSALMFGGLQYRRKMQLAKAGA